MNGISCRRLQFGMGNRGEWLSQGPRIGIVTEGRGSNVKVGSCCEGGQEAEGVDGKDIPRRGDAPVKHAQTKIP